MEEKSSARCKVCVTGAAGYIGSSLVKKLLDRGYTVHATLRNLEDTHKTGLLKSFTDAEKRLNLFQADIYKPEEFEQAIQGCEFVFHVATPLFHSDGFQYKNKIEATVASVKSIGMACLKSGTVRRLIYTASVVAASPLNDDGSNFKDLVDETCWTPLNVPYALADDFLTEYVESKTLAEKEILNLGNDGLEVVSLSCGLVGGNTYLTYTPTSMAVMLAILITNNDNIFLRNLKFLEELLGKVPIVHIEDVCEAHIFSMETPSCNDRFLCASSFVSTAEIATYYQQNYPQFHIKQEYMINDPKREVKWAAKKLTEKGFVYKYDMKMLLDDNIKRATEIGDLQLQQ